MELSACTRMSEHPFSPLVKRETSDTLTGEEGRPGGMTQDESGIFAFLK